MPQCETCPFLDGLNEEATRVQNYGCLPTAADCVQYKRETGHNWACHSDESKICKGLADVCKQLKIPLEGKLISYSKWYHAGAILKKCLIP